MKPVYAIFRKTLYGWHALECPDGYFDGLFDHLPEVMTRRLNFALPVNLNNIPHL